MKNYSSSRYTGKQKEQIEALQKAATPLGNAKDLEPLLKHIDESRLVLLGEASHGTHEYYTWRSAITKRLIEEKGFRFVAVEGDWPDCYRLNLYVKGFENSGTSAKEVLMQNDRWPTWMWANWEVVALAEWMKDYNSTQPRDKRVGFYGLDVYSLWDSMEAIMQYLEKTDPSALETAKDAIGCFEPYSDGEGQAYARATLSMVPASCEQEVVGLLTEIRRKAPMYDHDPEAVLSTEINAMIAVDAERYYRAMVKSGPESWNIRDRHMMDTLNKLLDFHEPKAKGIVWEHNTHIGDARATDMADDGLFNIGQLAREEQAHLGVVLVGFGSYEGTVIAGDRWGAPMEIMNVPEAKKGSWEELLHQAGYPDKLIITSSLAPEIFGTSLGHRAIGVVYHPEYEMYGNYVDSLILERYDAFIFLDKTKALHPLRLQPSRQEVPDTYPFGF